MVSKDLMKEENLKTMQALQEAMKADDEEGMQKAFQKFCEGIQQSVMNEAMQLSLSADRKVLAARGIRQLTSEEITFYQAWVDAHKSEDPKQAVSNISVAMPVTIIDSVVEDMKEQHELLNYVDVQNATGVVKMIVNAGDVQLAVWGALNSAITKELEGSMEELNVTQAKLSAFIPVPKDMLDLGPQWLDNYVRIILTEAAAYGMELAVLKGTGKNQPIGMCKDLKGAVSEGVYSDKEKVALTSLDPEEYCGVIAPLAVKPNGGYRVIPEVLFVVNPVDYIRKVLPSSTVRKADGTYANDIFPFPTRCIQSAALDENEAIIGIGKRYMLLVAAGTGSNGKLVYDDSYKFLEDQRTYLIKLFANGRPKDNNAFMYLNIENMKAAPTKVKVVEDTAATAATSTTGEESTGEESTGEESTGEESAE